MIKLSPSKIATYKQCPFKYKCETDMQIRLAYRKDTPDLVFGNLIHGCLNDFYKRTKKEGRNFETLRKLFETKFKYNFQKHNKIFKNKENIIKYVEESKKQFKVFLKSKFSEGEPLLTEDFPKYQLSSELELGGKFDRVDLKDNKLTLIDYKTGKYKEDGQNNYEFQLNFYEYLLTKKYPEYKVDKKILFYLKENKIDEYKSSKDLNQVEEEIINYAETIKNDIELKPKRNSLCNYCDYQEICSLFRKNL
ncbi:hypothetical protein COS31_05470 [Candidatus Roizmanbacteria bacterium CG02_land_8_20_14_3_00_36_15]|uniref:PD-(D/E)XK endonuclease-like domain-containing protein n=2 Tax=Candidatus Roizmaniibacteriota TaxID=1752723 RepID=A0A2M8KMC4_9BACT|nr:MAG: hypothetical protein COS51_01150 [Candidatus Roizmanbacteria bacterium CG03_land_8_20_14_0_80_36_21]PIV37259.1 MAG: hypothetical protein COS31_05470 [Candidatus Roizmanbacteria bacterium CG02_land_8_20_14_3_00_36_15]PIY70479.1 MAG: hypothetical protein COY89_00970 [Candidatus Roizmanbacteria bacterium CG_4_10_14_0_8_um_filter_36_36]PJA53599.1 MAG: hypothetical protein CO166_01285 [Candidatus Roizmanbacteria bacterium CG_4_9_14_3_um_filter_36_11]PJC81304.1 MAG: hypothetical protein CO007